MLELFRLMSKSVIGVFLMVGLFAHAGNPPPNIVVIMLDDLDYVTTWPRIQEAMPFVSSLRGTGLEFENAFITTPTCCPSRSSFFSGLYSHNSLVFSNRGPNGGRPRFEWFEDQALANILSKGGYSTYITGKYLNGFKIKKSKEGTRWDLPEIPVGWTAGQVFASRKSADNYKGYNYQMVRWGSDRPPEALEFGNQAPDYSTDVVFSKATGFAAAHAEKKQNPFFLYVAPSCPHLPLPPALRHIEAARARWPYGSFPTDRPNYGKVGLESAPSWIRKSRHFRGAIKRLFSLGMDLSGAVHPVDSPSIPEFNHLDWFNRMGSLMACDEGIANLVNSLKANGTWENTILFVTSDNGYQLGAHGLVHKTVPYEESVRVPLVVAGGSQVGLRRAQSERNWVLNIDFYPSILDLAGIRAETESDGRTFASLLTSPGNAEAGRHRFLMEYLGSGLQPGASERRVRLGIETPTYTAIRIGLEGRSYVFIKWLRNTKAGLVIAETELFEVDSDPFQMRNLMRDPAFISRSSGLLGQIQGELLNLESCRGATCH